MLQLTIITPTQTISKEASMIQVPGVLGETGILKGHAPLVSLLTKGFVKVTNGEKQVLYSIEEGIVSVDQDKIEVFTSSIIFE